MTDIELPQAGGERPEHSPPAVHLLVIPAKADDLHELAAALRDTDVDASFTSVDDAAAFRDALAKREWTAVLCDVERLTLDGSFVPTLLAHDESAPPLIVLCTRETEERAVAEMRYGGAADYICIEQLARFEPLLLCMLREHQRRSLLLQNLRASREQLDEVQRLAGIGSWEYDFSTGRHRWSDHLCRLYGFEAQPQPDLRALLARVHPDDIATVLAAERVAYEKYEPFSMTLRIAAGDGRWRTLDSRGRFLLDPDGRPLKLFGIVQDVSERVVYERELKRAAVLHAAVANLGQLALSDASLESLFRQASTLASTLLDADFCELLAVRDDGFQIIESDGWELEPESTPALEHARATVAAREPILVYNAATETRFAVDEYTLRHGVASGAMVPIASRDGEPWGVIGVHARRADAFGTTDIDFLRSIAGIVAQAIERANAENELRVRARQQSAIAQLGHATLATLDSEALEHACDLVAHGLGVDYAVFAALEDNGRTLRHRAGRHWGETLPMELPVSLASQSGMTVLRKAAVVVDDYATDKRFRTGPLAASAGVVSGLTVPIASAGRTWGVLGAQALTPRQFREADIEYLQSIANILAEAMERESGRAALVESETRHRSVVEGASEIIFTLAQDGTIISLNRAFHTITGWPREEWLGRSFAGLVDSDDRSRVFAMFAGLSYDANDAQLEVTIAGASGNLIAEISSFPRIVDGKRQGVYGFARDVTEARRVEREREQVTRSLELLLDSTLEGIYTMDANGICTMANGAALRMLGYSREEIVGMNLHELLHAPRPDGKFLPEIDCPIHRVLLEGTPHTSINDGFVRANGTILPVDYSAAPITDGNVMAGVVVSFSDRTERRRLELKLEQAHRISSLGRLAATVAHEFNNVLMGISPFIEVIRRKPADAGVALDRIAASVRRGRHITEEILRFTRPAELVTTTFRIEEWLESAAGETRTMLPPEYSLVVDVPDPQLILAADRNQLHQVTTNLILNARDAMPGGGTITLGACREKPGTAFSFGRVDLPERYVHFFVKDTGTGIPPETMQYMFEPLFTTKKSGTGLGLAVAHQVVQRHGGEIFAESSVGKGTTFHLFLPLAEGQEVSVESAPGSTPEPHSAHILIVDDEAVIAEGLSALLRLEGFTIDVAADGASAIAFVEKTRPDMVLLDVGLPDMSGVEVRERLRAIAPGLRVIFSTGNAESVPEGSETLAKPYDAEMLLDRLSRPPK